MQPSQKHPIFAGASLAASLLFLLGGALGMAWDTRGPMLSVPPGLSCERWAVSTSLAASSGENSNGKGEIEEQLRLLLEELKRLEQDMRDKFQKEILPYLKEEIEKLRNRLKEFSPGKEEAPPPQRIEVYARLPCPFE